MSDSETLQEVLQKTVHRAWEHRHAYRLEPTPASTAFKELHPETEDPIRSETIQTAYSAAMMRIIATEDALRSIAESLKEQPFAVVSLTRSSFEWCALARWLFDRQVSVETRLARGMTDYIYSLWQVSRLMTDSPERSRLLGRIDEERDEAISLGLRVEMAGGWQKGLYYVEERRPTTTALIDQLFSPVAPGLGAFMWQLLSGISHGTTGFMTEMFKEDQPPALIQQGKQLFAKKSAESRTLMMGATSLIGFLEAFGEMVVLYDWDKAAWREWDLRYRPTLLKLVVGRST